MSLFLDSTTIYIMRNSPLLPVKATTNNKTPLYGALGWNLFILINGLNPLTNPYFITFKQIETH
jgi:hypothetical protein